MSLLIANIVSFAQQRQDLRSLAIFRILLGAYILYDILSRLQHGRLSLLWYTSTAGSFLHPSDTPHKSPIHQVWFYRGSEVVQLCFFLITFLLALAFMLGYKCTGFSKTCLWLMVTSMQCRNMSFHDGSDTFSRHLLLWCTQLPVADMWSMDARSRLRSPALLVPTTTFGPAVWGLRVQIVLMYVGTVLNRTTDLYGWNIWRSKWMPPSLSAVHYSLNSSFASRPGWLGDTIRGNFFLTQFMTLSAMGLEFVAPIACMVMGDYAYIPAFLLFLLHASLLLVVNLPNWQFNGMLASIVWLPGHVWDAMQHWLAQRFPSRMRPPVDWHKKTDDDRVATRQRQQRNPLTYFFLAYMLYNFCGERKWIAKHDSGDIGEFLRFSQFWVMYEMPPSTALVTELAGSYNGQEIDVLKYIKTGTMTEAQDNSTFKEWFGMTYRYPSPRMERLLDQWGSRKQIARARYFLTNFCLVSPFEELTLVWRHFMVLPPRSSERWRRIGDDDIVRVDCKLIHNGLRP